jgi:hypothetical protein
MLKPEGLIQPNQNNYTIRLFCIGTGTDDVIAQLSNLNDNEF